MKRAFAIGYHVFGSNKRTGGFLNILRFLQKSGFSIDYLTTPSSFKWIFSHNDRENFSNFIKLLLGNKYIQNGVEIYNFTVPNILPYRMALYWRFLWKFALLPPIDEVIRRIKGKKYNIMLFESVPASVYIEKLKNEYKVPTIYRASDPLIAWMSDFREEAQIIEKTIFTLSDEIWLPNRVILDYYKAKGFVGNNIHVINNPLITEENLKLLFDDKLKRRNDNKIATYVGVFPIDYEVLKYAALCNPEILFIIIGPYKPILKLKNVLFTGPLKEHEVQGYISRSSIGIIPYSFRGDINRLLGLTRKIAQFLVHRIPLVVYNTAEIDIPGVFYCRTKEEFGRKISEIVKNPFDIIGEKEAIEIYEILEEYTYETFIQRLEYRLSKLSG
ncbi:hypothetical protein [Caldanaerobacter subterraneus]|uniref:Glycosyltransferase n=1 Tax=Caldanaerobacter subterraneus TaxID=911092 RepID=A0A7Y2L9R5_9THEO|nr:hypothetical protein [Caldanaerobacter subterraneus]NNG67950.1 hypothetical protein [Caldanaerobacter subterraneus]